MNAGHIYPGQGMMGPGIPGMGPGMGPGIPGSAVSDIPLPLVHRTGVHARSPAFYGKDIYHRNTGTSLLETFTLEQLSMHLSLTYEAATPARQAQVTRPHNPQEDTLCMVCLVTKLTFEPATLYCSTCGNKIKRSQTYYTVPPTHDTAESRVSVMAALLTWPLLILCRISPVMSPVVGELVPLMFLRQQEWLIRGPS